MESEVLHLHIGSAAINLGYSSWQLYDLEHRLADDAISPRCFYSEFFEDNRRIARPRALFIDYDSNAMDEIRTSEMKNVFDSEYFHLMDHSEEQLTNLIRKQIETCEQFQGFIFSHSTDGKCAHLSSQLLIDLKNEYSKEIILTNSIVGSTIHVSPLVNLFKYADVVIPMENKALFNICQHRLNIPTPTYGNINRLMAIYWSNITASMRLDGHFLANLKDFPSTLVPFSPQKLITAYLSPLLPYSAGQCDDFKSPSVYDMCLSTLCEPNFSCINQTSRYKLLTSLALLFRGEKIIPKEIGQKLIYDMRKYIRFSSHSPSGFRCGINCQNLSIFNDQSDLALTDKQVLMLTNETTTAKYLCQQALNQSSKTEADIEGCKEIFEIIMTYEQIEEDIMEEDEPTSEDHRYCR